jgi:diaminohydroxyphosphoribosylaminopyrimidine deaminase/5-amino-6-(5-phosphoribosylamino)uracil reductase
MNDTYFMKMALNLAAKGEGYTSPNPQVGAVVVKEGQIVGKGFHEYAGGPHAEVNALKAAGEAARGATLYVTLEPCNHTGRTPPCTQAVIESGIRKVVAAMRDPNPDVRGDGLSVLERHGLEVRAGICEAEASQLNEAFIKYAQTKRPFVVLKCAATLDGRIATKTGDSKWVTGEVARAKVHRMRHACDAIMVGCGTIKIDNPSLTTRIEGFKGKDPLRLILDTHLSIPEDARILHLASEADTLIVTAPRAPAERKAAIERKGVGIMEVPEKEGKIDLVVLMQKLGQSGVTSLLIEGGSKVIAQSLKAHIVDKINFFYAPKILGGNDGIPICSGAGPSLMAQSVPVHSVRTQRCGDDILIEGYINHAR